MKKKIIPSIDAVLDFIDHVEKEAKKGNIPKVLEKDASFEGNCSYPLT